MPKGPGGVIFCGTGRDEPVRAGLAALALIGKFPAEEVSSNLHRLKEVLETGRVTETSYSE